MSDHIRDGSSGTNKNLDVETFEEVRARLEKVKKRLHYLEQYAPELIDDVRAQVDEIRNLIA